MNQLTIIEGDALCVLQTLPADSVHCCVTSPPYWGLRDYGTARWEGGDPGCAHNARNGDLRFTHPISEKQSSNAGSAGSAGSAGNHCVKCGARRIDAQLGLEPTLDGYLDRLVAVFEEVKRVIHPSAVVFVDCGDSYASAQGGRQLAALELPKEARFAKSDDDKRSNVDVAGWAHRAHGNSLIPDRGSGLKPKDRCLVPFRLALRLQAAGWWVRDVIAWTKPAPMPESVTDRCTQAWEPILMLTKSAKYFWDAEAIKEPASENTHDRSANGSGPRIGADSMSRGSSSFSAASAGYVSTRNARNVWAIGPEPFTDSVPGPDGKPISHFAAFPSALPRRCILAATSAKGVCPKCGEPFVRQIERGQLTGVGRGGNYRGKETRRPDGKFIGNANGEPGKYYESKTTGWSHGCDCEAGDPAPAIVLDPFVGTGTTCAVALELGRNAVGIELNRAYCELARRRCGAVTPGLALA